MKLLLTALVIAGAVYVIRLRQQRSAEVLQAQLRQPPLSAHTGIRMPWIFAYAFLLLALAGSGIYLFQSWRDASQVVEVRVIDSRSGREVTYQAYRGDVGERSFETTDGRRVSLAEVERMELGGGEVPRR